MKLCPFVRCVLVLFASVGVTNGALLAQAASAPGPGSNPALTVHVDQPVVKMSPLLYGLMTEEIGHAYDGGLYAELIADRTFRLREDWEHRPWSLVSNAADGAAMALDSTTGPSAALPYSMKLTVRAATAKDPAGMANEG